MRCCYEAGSKSIVTTWVNAKERNNKSMALKGPLSALAILEATEIIDIARWSEILLLYCKLYFRKCICLIIFSSFTMIYFLRFDMLRIKYNSQTLTRNQKQRCLQINTHLFEISLSTFFSVLVFPKTVFNNHGCKFDSFDWIEGDAKQETWG